jgi:3-deoxy-manno-octulosonate cytidylyltransferase (CMP-KDO synthetase)
MKDKKILGVIPARLNSTRLPRKMLQDICGKPMIEWTYRQVKKASILDALVVATDSPEIADVVRACGGEVIITSSKPKTGTDRVAEAARKFKGFASDIVLNIQGDEPLMPITAITKTAKLLLEDPEVVMSTVARPFPKGASLDEPGQVKVVLDTNNDALYFSRSKIPFDRSPYTGYYNHLGIYGYRYDFLQQFVKWKQTSLEKAELLEQLRALEHGYRIRVGIGNYERVEVNEPHELEAARALMERLLTKNSNRPR